MGLLTGLWLQTKHTLKTKANYILLAGFTSVSLGLMWNIDFPINKKLWTSSYVLLAGGLSMILLALFIWLADLRKPSKEQNGSFASTALLVFGTNAIFSYVLSEVLATIFGIVHLSNGLNLEQTLYGFCHRVIPDVALASLVYSLGYVALCWVVVYVFLYRRRIFLKI